MVTSLVAQRSTVRFLSGVSPYLKNTTRCTTIPRRSIFNFFGRLPSRRSKDGKDQQPILTQDNLFHPFSKSPFPEVRARGDAVKSLAPCPVCSASHSHLHAHTKAQPRAVEFECPDCGWPTHCTKEHWKEDEEHLHYCSRLREANEDEHDLRSGRRLREFELPGKLCALFFDQVHCDETSGRATGI